MTTAASSLAPTVDFYRNLQFAFDFFNAQLFDNALPPCLITMRASGRQFGYHHGSRFINRNGDLIDELGLHPGFFTLRPVEEVLSTLVHEMVHHWQHGAGKPTTSNPHNREWAQKMREIGLEPSSTGLPAGKDSGRTVSHYIHPDGAFLRACRQLLAQGFDLQWYDRHLPRTQYDSEQRQQALQAAGVAVEVSPPPLQHIPAPPDDKPPTYAPPPRRPLDRVCYRCPGCKLKAWAKAEVELHCGSCELEMRADEAC